MIIPQPMVTVILRLLHSWFTSACAMIDVSQWSMSWRASMLPRNCGTSLLNPKHANCVCRIVNYLISNGASAADIGVVTTYKGQVAAIREELPEGTHAMTVSTVDSFQGQEREIIIFNTVRSSGHNNFSTNQARTNFALTRATSCVIIVAF